MDLYSPPSTAPFGVTAWINGIRASIARTGMMLSKRTIAGAAITPPSTDKNPRLVFCNPITSPLRWLSWVRFSLSLDSE